MHDEDALPAPDSDVLLRGSAEPGPDESMAPLAESAAPLAELADLVRRELAGLRAQVARDHERAAAREQIIDRLHDDNQRLRAGERRLLLQPLLTDLRRLRHEMLRTGAGLPAEFSGAQAAELLRSYAYNLELTLERGGISVFTPEIGTGFDASTQRAIGTVPAEDPTQDATVAEVVLDGYQDLRTDRAVVPAAVRVRRWAPVTAPEPPCGPEDAASPVESQPDRAATHQPT